MRIEDYLRALEHYAKTLDVPKTWYQLVIVCNKATGEMRAACNSSAAEHDALVLCNHLVASLKSGKFHVVDPEPTQ